MAQAHTTHSKILTEAGTNELEIITFYLRWHDPASGMVKKTSYGINAAKVRELTAIPEEITEVPERAPCVTGVFLLRGKTILLADMCRWFQYQADESPEAKSKWVIIVAEINGKPFGFITHGVDKVYRVSWEQIRNPPEILGENQSITGVCLVEDQLIQMIDFEKIAGSIDPSVSLQADWTAGKNADLSMSEKAVVIADDSTTIRTQIQNTLQAAGLKVIAHPDGQAAWEYLENLRLQGTIDETIMAVVTDIEMPRMDGYHLCLRIKEDPAYGAIPVILFSSMIGEGLRNKGNTVGADDQITKPELPALVDRLRACLGKLTRDE